MAVRNADRFDILHPKSDALENLAEVYSAVKDEDLTIGISEKMAVAITSRC